MKRAWFVRAMIGDSCYQPPCMHKPFARVSCAKQLFDKSGDPAGCPKASSIHLPLRTCTNENTAFVLIFLSHRSSFFNSIQRPTRAQRHNVRFGKHASFPTYRRVQTPLHAGPSKTINGTSLAIFVHPSLPETKLWRAPTTPQET